MSADFWTISLGHDEALPFPSYQAATETMRRALPDFEITFTIESLGGHPRDGYVHAANFHAVKNNLTLTSEFGCFGSAQPERDEESTYELFGLAVSVQGNAPWNEQRRVWLAIASAFAPLGYTDETLAGNVFTVSLREYLTQHHPDVRKEYSL